MSTAIVDVTEGTTFEILLPRTDRAPLSSVARPDSGSQVSGAAAVLLVHNHPTGDPTPSQEDIAITRRLKESGEILGIKVLDHIIIGDGSYFSFVEMGLL